MIAVDNNANNVRMQQLRELAASVQSRQIPTILPPQLQGAAKASKERLYDKIFSDSKFYPNNSKQELHNELTAIESVNKSQKGLARQERKQELRSQKAAQEYINQAKKMTREKEIAKK